MLAERLMKYPIIRIILDDNGLFPVKKALRYFECPKPFTMSNVSLPGFSFNIAPGLVTLAGRFNFQDSAPLEEAAETIVHAVEEVPERGQVTVFLYLDYVCTWARKRMMRMFHELENTATDQHLEVDVEWAYEEDDEDMLELGEIFQESFDRLHFKFKEIQN